MSDEARVFDGATLKVGQNGLAPACYNGQTSIMEKRVAGDLEADGP